MRKKKKRLIYLMLLVLLFSMVPFQDKASAYISNIDDGISINPSTAYSIPDFPGNHDYFYSKRWQVQVNGSMAGYMMLMQPKGDNSDLGRTFAHAQVLNDWVKAFNGNYEYVQLSKPQRNITRKSDRQGYKRYYSRDIAEASGAYLEVMGSNSNDAYLKVTTTPIPTVSVSAPTNNSDVTQDKAFNITFSAKEFEPYQASFIDYSISVDGFKKATGRINGSSGTKTEPITISTTGVKRIVVTVKDPIWRTASTEITVNVKPKAPTGQPYLEIDPSVARIQVGETTSYVANYYDASGKKTVVTTNSAATWSIGNTSIGQAQTAKGTYKGLKEGNTTVKVNYSGLSATAQLIVANDPPPTPPEPENEPPIVSIIGPTEVMVSENFCLQANASDSDGQIVGYSWSYYGQGSLSGPASCGLSYSEEGLQTVSVTVMDDKGATATAEHYINVIPPQPTAAFIVTGTEKENRKVNLNPVHPYGNRSGVIEAFPMVEERWKVSAVDPTKQEAIKAVQDLNGNLSYKQVIDLLFKKAGEYKVSRYVKNSIGLDDTAEMTITIQPDLPPVADFSAVTTLYRDDVKESDSDTSKAVIKATDNSYSRDDSIEKRIWTITFDENNNGDFYDDTKKVISNVNETEIQYVTDKVGKYLIELQVFEKFEQPTIEQFVDLSFDSAKTDRRMHDTAKPNMDKANVVKPMTEKVVEVDNLAPTVSYELQKKKTIEIQVAVGDTKYNKEQIESKLNENLKPVLDENGVNYKLNISPVNSKNSAMTWEHVVTHFPFKYYAGPKEKEAFQVYSPDGFYIYQTGGNSTSNETLNRALFDFNQYYHVANFGTVYKEFNSLYNFSINEYLKSGVGGWTDVRFSRIKKIDYTPWENVTSFKLDEAVTSPIKLNFDRTNYQYRIYLKNTDNNFATEMKFSSSTDKSNYQELATLYGSGIFINDITQYKKIYLDGEQYIKVDQKNGTGNPTIYIDKQLKVKAPDYRIDKSDNEVFYVFFNDKVFDGQEVLINEIKKNNAHLIGLGTESNKNQLSEVVSKVEKGIFIDNGNLDNAVKQLQDYVLAQLGQKVVDLQIDISDSPFTKNQLESVLPIASNILADSDMKLNVKWYERQVTTTSIIEGGDSFSHALRDDGTLFSWGNNYYGQLAISGAGRIVRPEEVSTMTNVKSVKAGDDHTLALRSDRTVWAWGRNYDGQLGDGSNTTKVPWRIEPAQVKNLTDVISIEAGNYHSVALKSDGTVWAWGYNYWGQLGDGKVGVNSNIPVQVKGLTDVVAITAGRDHTIALKSDGTVWAWGYNSDGQLGNGTTNNSYSPVEVSGLTDVKYINAGTYSSFAIKNNGTVWAWGDNFKGQLGDGTTIDRNSPVQLKDLLNVLSISSGNEHTLALKSDGTVWAWGNNTGGVLGDGNTVIQNVRSPMQVKNITNVVDIAAGRYHSLAVKSDGTVWSWGTNNEGQIGDGSTTNQYLPVLVSGLNLGDIPKTINTNPKDSDGYSKAEFTALISDKAVDEKEISKQLNSVSTNFIGIGNMLNQSTLETIISRNSAGGTYIPHNVLDSDNSTLRDAKAREVMKQIAEYIVDQMQTDKVDLVFDVGDTVHKNIDSLQSKVNSIVIPKLTQEGIQVSNTSFSTVDATPIYGAWETYVPLQSVSSSTTAFKTVDFNLEDGYEYRAAMSIKLAGNLDPKAELEYYLSETSKPIDSVVTPITSSDSGRTIYYPIDSYKYGQHTLSVSMYKAGATVSFEIQRRKTNVKTMFISGTDAIKDTFVEGMSSPSTVMYSRNVMSVGLNSTGSGSEGVNRAFMKFNLDKIPFHKQIVNSKLWLKHVDSHFSGYSGDGDYINVMARKSRNDWDESITYNSYSRQTGWDGTILASKTIAWDKWSYKTTSGHFWNIDVKQLDEKGIIFSYSKTSSIHTVSFATTESTYQPPVLIVKYIDSKIDIPESTNNQFYQLIQDTTLSQSLYKEIIGKSLAANTTVVGMGTSQNQSQFKSIISANMDKGRFINNSNMDNALNELADYIIAEVAKRRGTKELFVTLEDQVKYFTTYSDYEKDPKFADRWKYDHVPTVFENDMGQDSRQLKELGSPIEQFIKVGRYQPYYSAKDDPLTGLFPLNSLDKFETYRKWAKEANNWFIYVHRKPIPEFSFTINGTTGAYTIKNEAYDLDKKSINIGHGPGLKSQVWHWRIEGESQWREGLPSSPLERKVYEVKNTVVDLQKQEESKIKKMDATGVNKPPVAEFEPTPSIVEALQDTTLVNTSYDPNGDNLTAKWFFKLEGQDNSLYAEFATGGSKIGGITNPNWSPVTNFLNEGTYDIKLVVTDTFGATDSTERKLVVLPNNAAPTACFHFENQFNVTTSTFYIGDTIYVKSCSSDPDNDSLKHEYKIEKPNLTGGMETIQIQTGDTVTTGSGEVKISIDSANNLTIQPLTPDAAANLPAWIGTWSFTLQVHDGTTYADNPAIGSLTMINQTVKGFVDHTTKWRTNLTTYNVKYPSNAFNLNPAAGPMDFLPGEKFMLNAMETQFATDVIVHIQEHRTRFGFVNLIESATNIWTGSMWHKDMIQTFIDGETLTFEFVATFANGWFDEDTVTIKIKDDPYWRQHTTR